MSGEPWTMREVQSRTEGYQWLLELYDHGHRRVLVPTKSVGELFIRDHAKAQYAERAIEAIRRILEAHDGIDPSTLHPDVSEALVAGEALIAEWEGKGG